MGVLDLGGLIATMAFLLAIGWPVSWRGYHLAMLSNLEYSDTKRLTADQECYRAESHPWCITCRPIGPICLTAPETNQAPKWKPVWNLLNKLMFTQFINISLVSQKPLFYE